VTVSTHILDAVAGHPAAGVSVALSMLVSDGSWLPVETASTDVDGRLRFAVPTLAGVYRLTFATGPYFAARSVDTFYPEVTITFTAEGDPSGHYHVPLLLSPYAYSTYRGS
jgi:5-hydroxyisourate hydrolase